MKILRNLSTFTLLVLIVALAGCEQLSTKTIAEICTSNPELCDDLNPDSWCRAEKAQIIRHRYQQINDEETKLDPSYNYKLLIDFERYKLCIGKAAQIKHIKLREKETGRMKGYLTAQRELKRLSTETRFSTDPYLAYYQWSRHGHEDALQIFLRAAEEGELQSAALNVAHATFLVKRDSAKAINALYTALSLYTADEQVDPEIFSSLFTLHSERNDLPEAVVWGLVGAEYEASTMDKTSLMSIAKDNNLALDEIIARADALQSRIAARTFTFSQ